MAEIDPESNSIQPTQVQQNNLAGDTHKNGLYFNVNTARQDFINVFIDQGGDPFSVFTDPLRSGFKLFFHFDANSGLFADEKYKNSALAYLKRIGQNNRYQLLKTFINTLSKISSYSPWLFQSIDGIQDLYSAPFEEVYAKKKLTINCLETVDWRVSSLSQMYRTIAYDYTRRVEVLPVNLRRFSMSVYVYDFRNFDSSSRTNIELLQTIKNQDIKKLNHILFDLGYCQFDIASSTNMFTSVSNIDYEDKTSDIRVDYEKSVVSGLFRSISGENELNGVTMAFVESSLIGTTQIVNFDSTQGANTKTAVNSNVNPVDKSNSKYVTSRLPITKDILNTVDNLLDTDNWKKQLGSVLGDTEIRIAKKVNSALAGLFLGNVNGFTFEDLRNVAQSDSYSETFARIYQSITGNGSLALRTKHSDNLGNINK